MFNQARKGCNDQKVLKLFPNLSIAELINLSVGDLADNYPDIFKQFGAISFEYEKEFYPLIVAESAAGFFIGTCNDDGPQRESAQYFASRKAAEQALHNGDWIQWTPYY